MAPPAVIPQTLFVGAATAAGATILSSTTTTAFRITAILIANTDTSAHNISVFASIGPMTLNDTHVLFKNEIVDSGDTMTLTVPRVIGDYFNAGIGRLAIRSDVDTVVKVTVFGSEIDGDHPDVGRSAPVQSFQGVLTTNPAVSPLFGVVTANLSGVLMSLTLCNTSSANHSVDLLVSFDGGATFPELYTDFPVPANSTVEIEDPIIIGVTAGTGLEGLFASADADGFITATASMVFVDVS